MTQLLYLWSGVIPEIPLAMMQVGLINGLTLLLLVTCVVAIWIEREREVHVPTPNDLGGEHRLAA